MHNTLSWGEVRRIEIRHTGSLGPEPDGLVRLAERIRAERERVPDLVLVDTGNPRPDRAPRSQDLRAAGTGHQALLAGPGEAALGLDGILALADAAGCPCLAANWRLVGPGRPSGEELEARGLLQPWRRLRAAGLEVALLGLSTPLAPEGVQVLPAESVLQKVLEEAGPHAVVVVLSQLGLEQDRALASRWDGVQVILSGGAAQEFRQAEHVGGVLLVPPARGPGSLGALGLDLTASLVIDPKGGSHDR